MVKKKKKKGEEQNEPVLEENSATNFRDELNQPLWAVISFERREHGGLTYDEARRKIKELEKKGVAGLCIVTDKVAARIADKN